MDPNKCLFDLVQAIYYDDRDTAVELADALKGWLENQGFSPTNVLSDSVYLPLGSSPRFTVVKG